MPTRGLKSQSRTSSSTKPKDPTAEDAKKKPPREKSNKHLAHLTARPHSRGSNHHSRSREHIPHALQLTSAPHPPSAKLTSSATKSKYPTPTTAKPDKTGKAFQIVADPDEESDEEEIVDEDEAEGDEGDWVSSGGATPDKVESDGEEEESEEESEEEEIPVKKGGKTAPAAAPTTPARPKIERQDTAKAEDYIHHQQQHEHHRHQQHREHHRHQQQRVTADAATIQHLQEQMRLQKEHEQARIQQLQNEASKDTERPASSRLPSDESRSSSERPPHFRHSTHNPNTSRPSSVYTGGAGNAALRPHPLIRGHSYGQGGGSRPVSTIITGGGLSSSPEKHTGPGYLTSPTTPSTRRTSISSARSTLPVPTPSHILPSGLILSPALSNEETTNRERTGIRGRTLSSLSTASTASLSALATVSLSSPSTAKGQNQQPPHSAAISSLAHIPNANNRVPTPTLPFSFHTNGGSSSSSYSHGKDDNLTTFISFFPPHNPHQHLDAIHPLLPEPYLAGHMTVLKWRSPVREAFERVQRARVEVGWK